MIRLCELTGLSQADLTEVTSFVLGIHIAGAFAGNALFWTAKEILMLCEKLIDSFFDWLDKRVMELIRKRRRR